MLKRTLPAAFSWASLVLSGYFAVFQPYGARCEAMQPPLSITNIQVLKKPGHVDGNALATVNGKAGRIASHALQAWIIMDGQGALLLMSPQKKGQQYRLRYYELDAGRGRFLGHVPFAQATMAESNAAKDPWAFAIAGVDPSTHQSTIFAGDTDAIHARIDHGAEPQFSADSLSFDSAGTQKSIPITTLLGEEAAGRIYAPRNATASAAYLQFLPNGDAITTTASDRVARGRWMTDGVVFRITAADGHVSVWPLADLNPVAGIPATGRLTVRLLHPLSSLTARKNMAVQAVLISPGVFEGSILMPQGSEFDGKIVEVHGVGWGIKHESAAMTVHFDLARLPDGRTLPIDAKVYRVENSRENVTPEGKIQGIRSTGTIGHSAENQIASLAQIDPVAYLFTSTAGPAVLGFAEPEILYNAGTEIDIEFNKPVITTKKYVSSVPRMNPAEDAQFNAVVKGLPYRTKTQGTNKPSDITNLIFIGHPEALRRAFEAAGWTTADTLTASATFQTLKTLTGNQSYTQAPMSMLLLGDEKPLFTLQKTTNTFSSRHHLRVFATGETFDGQPVLTASSTQDIGIAFSYKQKTFIHVIDQYLDNERSKVSNDLEFTGCVETIDLVSRPWVPRDATNSTGDRLRTDGDAAVLQMNDCTHPRTTPTTAAERAPLFERSERNTALTIKDTLYRGNLVYTGISGGIKVHNYLATSGELGDSNSNWQKSDASGTQYRLAGTAPRLLRRTQPWDQERGGGQTQLDTAAQERVAQHRWDPPHFEIGIQGGYSRYVNNFLEETLLDIEPLQQTTPPLPSYLLGLGDAVFDGWAAGVSLTLNSWNHISNEFAYTQQQTKFDLVGITVSSDPQQEPVLDVETVGLTTRQTEYNMLFHALPRKSRFRPYVAAGPALQLISLAGAPLKKPSGYFRLGLSNIGLIKAAFDFGSVAPLNGGGVFEPALQYGGGIKYRVLPRLMLRADVRESWSKNPKLIRNSYLGYEPDINYGDYTTTVTNISPPASYRQQRLTVGFAFTF